MTRGIGAVGARATAAREQQCALGTHVCECWDTLGDVGYEAGERVSKMEHTLPGKSGGRAGT